MNIFNSKLNPILTRKRTTWLLLVPLIAIGFLFLGQLVAVVFDVFLLGMTSARLMLYPEIMTVLVGGFGFSACLLWLWLWFFEKVSFAHVGLKINGHTPKAFLLGFVGGLMLAALVVLLIWLSGNYIVVADVGELVLLPIVILMLGFMVQSSVEELFFRGWMLSAVSARFGILAGIVSNSLVFALIHMDERVLELSLPVLMILITNLILVAVLFSLIAINAKNIWAVCAMHASWNWSLILWYGVPTTGIEFGLKPLFLDFDPTLDAVNWMTGGSIGPEGSIFATLILSAACLLAYRKYRLNKVGL